MRKLSTAYFAFLIAVSQAACVDVPTQYTLPSDVTQFVTARGICDTLRGEIPDPSNTNDSDMKEAIDEANASCKGTDTRLSALKKKYTDNSLVTKKLQSYEVTIERHQKK